MRAGLASALKLGWLRLLLAAVLAAGCAAAVAATDSAVAGSGVIGLRLGGDRNETRIVVDLDRGVSAKAPSASEPATRLVLFLPSVGAGAGLRGPGLGLVRAWKLDNRPGGGRLTLQLARAGAIRRRFLLPPSDAVKHYRYVIDVDAAVEAPALTARPIPVLAVAQPLPPARHQKRVVVIDAGHGGHDPGAQSASHAEKDITLQAAQALKARLERGGRYKVVMTRASDIYVPLEERVQIARRAGADLFISLHADSAGADVGTHGASVYTLSDEGGARVTRVLDRHEWFNKTAARDGDPAVGQILLDLTQRSTRNRSAVFAQILVDRVGDQVDLLPRSHRDAGYFVLLAPDVPAVLLEMGFITSADDEKRLTDPVQRRRLMDTVAEAIDTYFAGQSRFAAR